MNNDTTTVLLLAILTRLEAESAATRGPPKWQWWLREEHDEARAHGPAWSAVTALADGDAERVRLGRVRNQLEEAGQVVCLRHRYSARVSRVRLTAEGKKAAASAATKKVDV